MTVVQLSRETTIGSVQLILVSATMPTNLNNVLDEFVDVDDMARAVTKRLHCVMPHVKHTFINLHKYDRDAKLISLVKGDVDNHIPVMIFSNRTPQSNWIHHFLNDNGIDNVLINKSVTGIKRLEAFERYQCGDVHVMSCTDLASRGLDTTKVSRQLHELNH